MVLLLQSLYMRQSIFSCIATIKFQIVHFQYPLSGIISYNNYFNKFNQFLELPVGFLCIFTLMDYCSSSTSPGNIFHSF